MGEKSFSKPRNHILATLYEGIIDAFRKAARLVWDLPGNLLYFLILGESAKEINTVDNVFFVRIYPIFSSTICRFCTIPFRQ
jgi:hypothetical protein